VCVGTPIVTTEVGQCYQLNFVEGQSIGPLSPYQDCCNVSVSDVCLNNDNFSQVGDRFVNSICSGINNVDDLHVYSIVSPSSVSSYVHPDDHVNSFDDGFVSQGVNSLYGGNFDITQVNVLNDLQCFDVDNICNVNVNYNDDIHDMYNFESVSFDLIFFVKLLIVFTVYI
jgi:hypothetical protein